MNKNKLFILILCFAIVFSFSFVLADGDETKNEEAVVSNLATAILGIMLWAGWGIVLGSIIIYGIKYMTAAANDKAKLKGIVPMVAIGIALIAFSLVISKFVVNTAGNEGAEDIFNVAEEAGNHFNK